jgi:hypothetical protein
MSYAEDAARVWGRDAEEERKARRDAAERSARLGERGLNSMLTETNEEMGDLLEDLAEGMRGPGAAA